MKSQRSPVEYSSLAAEAEQAVSAVKDPELRRVAFEKILTTLLEQTSGGSGLSRTRKKGRALEQPVQPMSRARGTRQRRGPKPYVEELIDEGYFKKQRTIAAVKAELANRGHHIALTSLSGPLQRLTQARRLRRQKAATNAKGTKTTFVYSNW